MAHEIITIQQKPPGTMWFREHDLDTAIQIEEWWTSMNITFSHEVLGVDEIIVFKTFLDEAAYEQYLIDREQNEHWLMKKNYYLDIEATITHVQ